MLKKFQSFVEENKLFTFNDNLLVAVSGGIDSVVLCHLLHLANYKFAIAHVNFKLRNQDSELDAQFVSELAKKLNVNFYLKEVNTTEFSKANKISIQAAARKIRYDWFDFLLKKHDYNYLLTAHHLNDSFETAIYNFIKGTGIKGLRGIKTSNGHIKRPLLFATKKEIHDFAIENMLSWRDDISNIEDKYNRNHLRINVLPKFEKVNPSYISTFAQTSANLQFVEKIFFKNLENTKVKVVSQNENIVYIDKEKLLEEGVEWLYFILDEYDFADEVYKILTKNLFQQSGKIFLSEKFKLTNDRSQLIITPISTFDNNESEILVSNEGVFHFLNLTIEINTIPIEKFNMEKATDLAQLDFDTIQFPLRFRKIKNGDKIQPLGLKGASKKISDLLIDKKKSLVEKSKTIVVESNKNIVWVSNICISELCKVTSKTKKVLIIKSLQ